MGKGYKHMTKAEIEAVRNLHRNGMGFDQIRDATGRSKDTLSRHIFKKNIAKKAKGRPRIVTAGVYIRLEKALAALQKKAGGLSEVTVTMVKARARATASDKAVLKAFHARGVYFRKLRERPILTEADVAERLAWAKRHVRRTEKQWVSRPHAVIDNKHFQLYTNKTGREHAARRGVRGAFRKKGDPPHSWLVRPKASLKFPAKGVTVAAAVVNGRVRMWEYIEGSWNGAKAAAMYRGPLIKALKKGFPDEASKRRPAWVILEDNDPTGYKSSKGVAAKRSDRIHPDSLPRRSPDLNVLDYSLWHEIKQRMREEEKSFAKGKKESPDEYKARLRRIALAVPRAVVEKAMGDMRRRAQAVVQAGGALFKE